MDPRKEGQPLVDGPEMFERSDWVSGGETVMMMEG
jgi:hypothetical protein